MRFVVPHPAAIAATALSAAHCASGLPVPSPISAARPDIDTDIFWPPGAPRTVMVLGAGGVPGVAWQAATLEGLAATGQVDVAHAPVIIGTSAGSLVAILLRSGLSPESISELVANGQVHNGLWHVALPGDPSASDNPWRLRHTHGLSTPQSPLEKLRHDIDVLWNANSGGSSWPSLPTWIVATDAQTGERLVLGSPNAPLVSPGTAVAASCAMPILLSPINVGDRTLVDGAMSSFTSLDLALMLEPEEVYLLDPAAAIGMQWAWNPRSLAVSAARSAHGRLLDRDIAEARERGQSVKLMRPSAEELGAMGTDLLDIGRCRKVVEVTRKSWQT